MNHSWNDVYYTIVKSHVPGDPTHKRILLDFISLFVTALHNFLEMWMCVKDWKTLVDVKILIFSLNGRMKFNEYLFLS